MNLILFLQARVSSEMQTNRSLYPYSHSLSISVKEVRVSWLQMVLIVAVMDR